MNKLENYSVLYLLPKVLFLGFGFKLMIIIAGSHAWISIILGILIGLGINFCLTKIMPGMHRVIVLIYSLIFLIIGLILMVRMISRIYLDAAPIWYILIPILLLIFYTITKKENTIYRVSSILVIFQMALLGLAFIILTPSIEMNNLIDLNQFHEISIINASIIFAFLTTSPYVLLTNFKEQYNYKTYLISCLTLLFITILIIGGLTTNVALLFDYPEYVLFKSINIIGYLENIENFLFSIWFIIYFPFLTIAAYNIKKVLAK